MSLLEVAAPDLRTIGAIGSTLWVLEASSFSSDGKTLLVKAIYTLPEAPEYQRYAVWSYDLASQSYTDCLNAKLAVDGLRGSDIDVLSALSAGPETQRLVIAEYAMSDGSGGPRLALVRNASVELDVWNVLGLAGSVTAERYALSADGRFLAVQTSDTVLAPNGDPDVNQASDIYLLDLKNLKTERVSFVAGTEATLPVTLGNVVVTDDQVRVTFSTAAETFSKADKNASGGAPNDAYLWSRTFTDTGFSGAAGFALISADTANLAAGGVPALNNADWSSSVNLTDMPTASTAGVWFESTADNLVAGDANAASDIFLRPYTGATQHLGLKDISDPALQLASVSADGRYVAVLTRDAKLVGSQSATQLLAWQSDTQNWVVLSAAASGQYANADITSAVLSPDGRWAAMTTQATNLINPEPTALGGQLYLASLSSQGQFNAAPVASQTSFSLVEDTFKTGTLAATDAEGNALTFIKNSEPQHGSLILDSRTGVYTYTPVGNYNGSDSFTFKVNDGAVDSATATVSVTVTPLNDNPTGSVSLSGIVAQGQTLKAANTLADADGMGDVSYQWLANGSVIDGAVGSNLTLGPALVGQKISVRATYIDGAGTQESVISPQTEEPVVPAYGATGQVYHWKTHALLTGVDVSATGAYASTTDVNGRYSISGLLQPSIQLQVSKALTMLEAASAITEADAHAALLIASGRNPNADGSPVSPYQFIAADINEDGRVTSIDALAILKVAKGKSDAPALKWLFVDEGQDFWNEAVNAFVTTRNSVAWDKNLPVDSAQPMPHNLVAVLKGDVNGSWLAPPASVDLDVLNPSYFTDLAEKLGVPLAQWSVIAG